MGRKEPRRVKVEELQSLLLEEGGGVFIRPFRDYDEVYPGVFCGGKDLALDIDALQELGITHIINCAKGNGYSQIDTSPGYYRRAGIDFLGINALDNPSCSLRSYFKDAASFIDTALYSGGKVYVHCECGISRAATIVTAFLMIRRGLSARQALAAIRSKRSILPNEGFLTELSDLDYEHQQKGLIRTEPEMYSAMDELSARYDYPLEYYHYPSLYPRTTTRFIKRSFSRDFSPPPTRAEIRAGIRARSEERALPLVRYRASSLPPTRSSTPIRDLTPYHRSNVHVYGTRTPITHGSVIDNEIVTYRYRPSTVTYTPHALRALDYEVGPLPFSTYRTSSYYRDLPSSVYDSRRTAKIRYQLEPRYTSPLYYSSIVPSTRYGSSTLTSPVSRYLSTPSRVYISYPTRYNPSPSRMYGIYEPHLYRSTYTQHKYGDGFPTKYETYKLIYPSTYGSYLGKY